MSMELSTERDLGCSVFIQNGNARLSGACAALQCSLGGDAWAGPGMTGSSPPTRETGVTNAATASWTNFTVVEISGERIECVPLPNRRLCCCKAANLSMEHEPHSQQWQAAHVQWKQLWILSSAHDQM